MGDAIIGRWSCGCITYANTRPTELDRESRKEIADIVARGGEIVRTTVEEARQMPHFLPMECPHEPKGWAYEPPPEPKRLRYKKAGRDIRNVDVVITTEHIGGTSSWPRGLRGGQVVRRKGKWWATEGWFDYYSDEPVATDGREPRGPSEVLGPFDKQAQAGEALIPLAEARAKTYAADLAERRARKAAA